MIRIRLVDHDNHRNECTFRPYWVNRELFRAHGIEFSIGTSNDYDLAWVGHASISNKKLSLEESTERGLDFLKTISAPYMIIDGQDSPSLMGTAEVFTYSDALCMLKSSLYSNRSCYREPNILGRKYWNHISINDNDKYVIPDACDLDRIYLSGTNWISTHFFGIDCRWYTLNKIYDLAALFQYPSTSVVYEHGHEQSFYYDAFRSSVIDIVDEFDKMNIIRLKNGIRVSLDKYYQYLMSAKIILAPFGYGEIAPRDLEAAMFGSLLIKPNMQHLETLPNIYDETTCLMYDYVTNDLRSTISRAFKMITDGSDYEMISMMRNRIQETMHPLHIVAHLKEIL